MSHFLSDVDPSWTLFLDRDGVINERMPDDYVQSISQFHFLPGVLEALYRFDQLFYKIIVVTNQQGIALEKYSHEDLDKVHSYLQYEVSKAHGRVDAIYYCPHLVGTCKCRKPEIGMAISAKNDFRDIDFDKSIMVGDSWSDIGFANKAGMKAVKLLSTHKKDENLDYFADIFVNDLIGFYRLLASYKERKI
jgi:D-glycero-D-manno-heptose 1,7-bisphosphate phosphatase